MDSQLVPTKPNGPPKGSWEPDDHGAEGGTARGPGRPTSRSKAEDKDSDRPQRACWIPGSLNGEGAVESRAGLWGAPCGCDLGRTCRVPTDRLCAKPSTTPTVNGNLNSMFKAPSQREVQPPPPKGPSLASLIPLQLQPPV